MATKGVAPFNKNFRDRVPLNSIRFRVSPAQVHLLLAFNMPKVEAKKVNPTNLG